MSDQPSWRPSDEEIKAVLLRSFALSTSLAGDSPIDPVVAMIDRAVEKALAEQKQQLERRHNDFWNALLTKREARHKREVLQAKIDTLDDLWHATKRDHSGKAVEVAFASHVTPSFIREEVDRLAAELAALDGKAPEAKR